ncbi:MAG: class I SAM-dependent methyltransferase [Elusimicrobia bacterium]|nr:class I SAM-dependent methyltransferase [Elusimicrobiota bacterium]
MANDKYQYDYSAIEPEMSDSSKREQKGRKILSVLSDHYGGALGGLELLDIGCSMGFIANLLASEFGKVVGADIDIRAVEHAKASFKAGNLAFVAQDGIGLEFADASFDVVVCNHVYEHVPDRAKLFSEIRRVLKPGGVCYLAAANRLGFLEPHHRLPLLSWLPKPLAHVYVRLAGTGDSYYETLLTLGGIRDMVRGFEVVDYTRKILRDPVGFSATEMVAPGSFAQAAALFVFNYLYWLMPTYIWLLKK